MHIKAINAFAYRLTGTCLVITALAYASSRQHARVLSQLLLVWNIISMGATKFLVHVCIVLVFGASHTALAVTEKELNERVNEIAAQAGITDKKQLESFKAQVLSMMRAYEHFAYVAIKEPCEKDIVRFCSDITETSAILDCMKANRDQVVQHCELALRHEFGGKPLTEAQWYQGILVPKGSKILYDAKGSVVGAKFSESFTYKNIDFASGQVRFHTHGISVGRLAFDQSIDGVKYSADGIGPFFNENGNVVNATLSENTEIKGIVYKGGSQIQFYSKDVVQSGTVAKEVTVQGKTYAPDSLISFERSGALKSF